MDRGSELNKVDRPVDPRGGSTSSPELICRRPETTASPAYGSTGRRNTRGSSQRQSGAKVDTISAE